MYLARRDLVSAYGGPCLYDMNSDSFASLSNHRPIPFV